MFYSVDDFMRDFSIVCESEDPGNIRRFFATLDQNIRENKERFTSACIQKNKPYALCLSQKRDNLTHWDRYAAASTGVCIGVNLSALTVLHNRTGNSMFGPSLFDIGEILYTEDNIYDFIRRRTIRNIGILIEVFKDEFKGKLVETMKQRGYTYMVGVCQNLMHFAKNTSFIDEGEVRLYFDEMSIERTNDLIEDLASDCESEACEYFKTNFTTLVGSLGIDNKKFYLGKAGIRSYHSLCLNEVWGPGLIPEIILGPMCVQNRNELLQFLSANELSGTKVSVSKVPLR